MSVSPRKQAPSARHSTPVPATWRRALLGAESRWPAFAAVLMVILGQTVVSRNLQLQPVWLLPGIAAVLLVLSVGF